MLILPDNIDQDIALLAKDERGLKVTYKTARKFADEFNKIVSGRCLVFIICDNNIESLLGYISCFSKKTVSLLLELSINEKTLIEINNLYKPKYIWLPRAKLTKKICRKIVFKYRDYYLIETKNLVDYKLDENLALLLSTSGSTGNPKFVRLSYENIISNAKSISQYLNLSSASKAITSLPMNYSFGLSIINSHLFAGGTLLITNKSLFDKSFWEFFNKERPSSISGVPYTFEILKKLKFFKMDVSFLKTITQAGGRLSNELQKEYAEFCLKNNIQFYIMYGQTEASPRMSFLNPKLALNKIGGIGAPIPGGSISLVNEKNEAVEAEGEVGEIIYSGKNVCMGYAFGYLDLNKGDENKGSLRTGDLAIRDKSGCYFIKGRKNRFVKLFGNRVNLDDIEKLASEFTSDINNLACVGVKDKLVLFVAHDSQINPASLKKYISLNVNINSKGIEVRYISKIPKNKSGKTIYAELLNQ